MVNESLSLAHVFRAYDIRGLSPEELDEPFARRLARAIVGEFDPKRIVVGHDMRLTSRALETAFIETVTALGVDVVRIGLCSTPMFNCIVGLADGAFDLGVMVTASHNPGAYNGFKLIRGDSYPIAQGTGMEEIAAAFARESEDIPLGKRTGTVTDDREALRRYVDHVVKLAALPADMPKMKIAVDAGNGMEGVVLPELVSRFPWLETLPLYVEPDGSFPNHEANPLKTETLKDLSALVVKEGCDAGFAFDGDADRMGLVDEKGVPVAGDLGTAFIAQEVLRTFTGEPILYDVRSSWTVPEAIREAGGKPIISRVGHAFIKRHMREVGAVFAGEVSMHYYFRDLKYAESGDLVLLLTLRRLARERKSLSELINPLRRYAHSGEINFEVPDKDAALRRVREAYVDSATEISEIDGMRMEFRDAAHPEDDWWFNVRLSNTEPLVRLNLETRSEAFTAKKTRELSKRILPVLF